MNRTKSKASESRRIRENVKHVAFMNLIIRMHVRDSKIHLYNVRDVLQVFNDSLNDMGITKLIKRLQKVILQFVFPQ